MRKIKILCLDHYTKVGGGQRSLLILLKNLDRDRFYPIVAIPEEGEFYEQLRKLGIDIRFVGLDKESIEMSYTSRYSKAGNPVALLLNLLSSLRVMASLRYLIKTERIDLIYANTFKTALIGGITGKLFRTPIVYHVRTFPNHGWLDHLAVFLSNKVVVNSRSVARELQRQEGSEKIEVIYNAIDLLAFNPAINGNGIRSEFEISRGEMLVGMVGRVAPEKGHQTLVQASMKIISVLPRARVLIVGDAISKQDEEYKMQISQLVKSNGLGNKFTLTGFRRDIPEVMAALDLLVIPSIKEPWGRVAAEAMAVGKPVVGTNVGGLPEIIDHGQTGILVSPEDPKLLAEAIITLLKDEGLRKRMGKAGRKKIEENFSIPIVTRQMEGLYLEALEGVKATNELIDQKENI